MADDLAKYEVKSKDDLEAYVVSGTGESPETQAVSGIGEAVKRTGKEMLAGAGRGLMHTGIALSPFLNKIPYIGETLAPSEGIRAAEKMATPTTPAEKAGFTGEQIAEWLLPTGAEEKGGVAAARMLPKLGRFAEPLGRIATGALESGVRANLQSGDVTSGKDFGTGALMGGAAGIVGEGMRAIAPKLAESSLGITNRMRGRGKTIGKAVLEEIPGVRPGTIAKEAGAKLGDLTKEMETGVHTATQGGVTGSTQPAHDVLNTAIQNTPRNARELLDKLRDLRDVLSLQKPVSGQAPRMIHTPDELLEIRRGIDKTIKSWGPEWQKSPDVQGVTQRMYGAIDQELDRLVPGNKELNQRISSLIPARSQAKKMSQGAGLSQRMLHRAAAHTGAMLPSIAGGYYGYEKGGVPGAVAGALLPEMMASPTGQMMGARMMRSPATTRLLRAGGSQLVKRNGKSKSEKESDEEE